MTAQQIPQRLRMPLHAVRAADHQNRSVQHLQRALHFRSKIHMSRRIQQRNLPSLERKLCLLGKNRDAALAFHGKRIQKRILMIHAPQCAHCTSPIQQRLTKRRLTRIHMSQNTDHQLIQGFHLPILSFLFDPAESHTAAVSEHPMLSSIVKPPLRRRFHR